MRGRPGPSRMGGKEVNTQLVQPETPAEKDDGENADEEHQGAPGHLVNRDRGIEEADVHQLYRSIVTKEGNMTQTRAARVIDMRSAALGNIRWTHRRSSQVAGGREPQEQDFPAMEVRLWSYGLCAGGGLLFGIRRKAQRLSLTPCA